ncbi:MAG: 3-methylaspartate ammonia-lyase, partial [Gammaproteobacteria bacterium]
MNHSISILSPTAILGYGFPEASFEAGLAREPDAIAVDAGSTDPGPYYLGSGESFTNREAVKRDLTLMIEAGLDRRIPVLVGTAGGSGAKPHLQWCLEIIDEVLCDLNRSALVAEIAADQDQETVTEALRAGRISALGPVPQLTEDAITNSTYIVAQMGVEPVIDALEQ